MSEDGPFYEYAGPCSENEHDLKYLINHFNKYLELKDEHLSDYAHNNEIYNLPYIY